jgi:aminopeptidase N
MGLLDRDGRELPLTLAGEALPGPAGRVLELHAAEETFTFTGLTEAPVPALLRTFSAPVRIDYDYTHDELVHLMAFEPDPFCRWEAGQLLGVRLLLGLVADRQAGRELVLDPGFVAAFRATLTGGGPDRAFLAEALTLPTEGYLAELMPVADQDALFEARRFVRRTLAEQLREEFLAVRTACRTGAPYAVDDGRAGDRRLANLCLAYLMTLEVPAIIDLCLRQLREADNMTDTMGALAPLASCDCPERLPTLEAFYERWRDDRQVVDKWFSLRATSSLTSALEEVTALLEHPDFELANPNRFRSLVGAFSQANLVRFHALDGKGYRFLTDQLLRLIPVNPQVAARLLGPMTRWRRFDPIRRELMKSELERIRRVKDLPRDVYEVVAKSLAEK